MEKDVHEKNTLVFLFKSLKEDTVDKYSELLSAHAFTPVLIPTLSFQFCNVPLLTSQVTSLHLFSAIIFTSPRSVEAFVNASRDIPGPLLLTKVTCYVVGQATAEAARTAGFLPIGEETGHGEALAELIINKGYDKDERPMLMPCSNLRRDTIIDALSSYGIPLTETIAYETRSNDRLAEVLQQSLTTYGVPDYTVFFSPSCFQFFKVLNIPMDKTKMVAIGPSTSKAMSEQGCTPHTEAARPDPGGLLAALRGS